MPMHWNDAADAKIFAKSLFTKLFAAVLATGEVKLKYDDLADWMGAECTAKAIQHRISAVRKMTKETITSEAKITQPKSSVKRKVAKDDGDGEGEADATEDTPAKAKKARAPRKKAAPKTPKKVVDTAEEVDGEDVKKDVVEEEDTMDEESEGPVVVEDAGLVGGDD